MPRNARNGFTGHEVATTHGGTQSAGSCRYHNTNVVSWDPRSILLDTGGWRTSTTKHRMNQAAASYKLEYSVHQSRRRWLVTTKGGEFLMLGQTCRIDRVTGEVSGADRVKKTA